MGAVLDLNARRTGTLMWYNFDKGYGFIRPQDGGQRVYVDHSALEAAGLNGVDEGDAFIFAVEPHVKGLRAKDLEADRKIDQSHDGTMPASIDSATSNLSVQIGEGKLAKQMGFGLATGGQIQHVGHVDGKTVVDYSFKGHDQSMQIADRGVDGYANPLSLAVDALKPGDNFKLAIDRDVSGMPIAHLENRTTGQHTDIRENGTSNPKDVVIGQHRSRGRD